MKLQHASVFTDLTFRPNDEIYTKREVDALLSRQNFEKRLNQTSVGVQISEVKPYLRQTGTQTAAPPPQPLPPLKISVGIMKRPDMSDVGCHYAPQLRTVGVSDDTVSLPAPVLKHSVAVGPDTWAPPASPVSLKAIDRSVSFSLAEKEKLKLRRKHVATQATTLTAHASVQHHPSYANKMIQNVPDKYSQTTDTRGLIELRHFGGGTETKPVRSKDAFVNTEAVRTREHGVNVSINSGRQIDRSANTDLVQLRDAACGLEKIEIRDLSPPRPQQVVHVQSPARPVTLKLTKTVVERTSMPPSPQYIAQSQQQVQQTTRIPRPTQSTPSPTLPKKFVRQNTYTISSQTQAAAGGTSVGSTNVEKKLTPPRSPSGIRKFGGGLR